MSVTRAGTSLDEQKQLVLDAVLANGIFNPTLITSSVEWFFSGLGMHDYYFDAHTAEVIASHVQSLEAAKLLAQSSGTNDINVRLAQETETSAFFAAQSGIQRGAAVGGRVRFQSPVTQIELKIEDKFLMGGTRCIGDGVAVRGDALPGGEAAQQRHKWRLQCFRTTGTLSADSETPMRVYFLTKPDFANPTPAEGETRLEEVADRKFLSVGSDHLKSIFQDVLNAVQDCETPVIRTEVWTESDGVKEARLVVGFRQGSTHSYFYGCADAYRAHGMFAPRKYVEFFSNGTVIYSFYLRQLQQTEQSFEDVVARVVADSSLCFVLPRTSLSPMVRSGELTVPEAAYAYAAWKFAFHFLQRYPEGYEEVAASLKRTDQAALGRFSQLKDAMKAQLFTEGQLLDVLLTSPELAKALYSNFQQRHAVGCEGGLGDEACEQFINRSCASEEQLQVYKAFFAFNQHVVRTNFFQPTKVALSFRMDPGFLSAAEYPLAPYAVVYIIGSEFRGFHVRFEDVARGGVRLIRSAYPQAYTRNVTSVFDECYGLASTQQRKNKDIPEGGSKGCVLLNLGHQDKASVAFKKYVDAFVDLLLPDTTTMVDHLAGAEEIVFLGPDEGTADLMDWASAHSRCRGYRYWKAFTTGKSPSLGGIPHDTYGMTTHSVRQYVLGIQERLGLDAGACLKMQTGGPDGDLGSNEILMSLERTNAIVDGSGVLCDPDGLPQDELVRLARNRQMVVHVDKSKLGPNAYLVLVEETGVTLPDGTVVESGMQFRNTFHLNHGVRGDFFVPCGGRPAAVTLDNVQQFMRLADGSLRFKYVVEGANLFFTQEARAEMERAGIVLFKDASANKGGVTSSSLEVLAALVLTDAEFQEHMSVTAGAEPPAFYAAYVRDVQAGVDTNARLEFECIWREHERTGKMRSTLSDELSNKIVQLRSAVTKSALWDNAALRNKVLAMAVPDTLQRLVPLETILERLPAQYTRALFASQLASRFVYHCGLSTPEFAFYEFVNEFAPSS